ncbi:MAG: glycosyltransferase [Proteobacteria bacterium]|nr:glycosyltransferase [Pseudomonadota bacterium]
MIVDVTFITVNYNTQLLLEDLVFFFRSTPLPFTYTFTVVDNASGDDSLGFLASCPEVTTIANNSNVGYGRAMNQGIAASSSRYLCLLNTDIILNSEALTALVEYCDKHPTVNVCSPIIQHQNGKIQGGYYRFNLLYTYLDIYKKIYIKLLKLRLASRRGIIKVNGIAGAFIFCRRGIVSDDKLFDEDFFFYYEDTELAHRLYKQGMTCHVLCGQSVIHLGGQSSSNRHVQQLYVSKYLYLTKQYGDVHAKTLLMLDIMRVHVKRLFYSFVSKITPSENIRNKLDKYIMVSQSLNNLYSKLHNKDNQHN